MNPDISASTFHRFFDDKVVGVRAATSGASPPSFSSAPLGCSWFHFQPLTVEDVVTAVRQLPDKCCVSDPMPTSLLKDNIQVLAPFLTFLFNQSLSLGSVPSILKAAYITPRLKKPDLDTLDVKSYRPISNLPVLIGAGTVLKVGGTICRRQAPAKFFSQCPPLLACAPPRGRGVTAGHAGGQYSKKIRPTLTAQVLWSII